MTQTIETDILYRALVAPYGLAVKVSDVKLAESRFARAKQLSNDAQLANIRIFSSRTDPFGELWIVNAPLDAQKETTNG